MNRRKIIVGLLGSIPVLGAVARRVEAVIVSIDLKAAFALELVAWYEEGGYTRAPGETNVVYLKRVVVAEFTSRVNDRRVRIAARTAVPVTPTEVEN